MQSPASLAFIILNGPAQDAPATSIDGLETVTIAGRSHTVLDARLSHVSWISRYRHLECPVVLITPEEQFPETDAYLRDNDYFGLNRTWFFHEQWPMIPAMSADGNFILKDNYLLLLLPAGELEALCSFLSSDSCAALVKAGIHTLQVAPARNLGATYHSTFLELLQEQEVDLVVELAHSSDSTKQTVLIEINVRPRLVDRAQLSDKTLLDSLSVVATGTYWLNLHRLLALMGFSVKSYLKQSREDRHKRIWDSFIKHTQPLLKVVNVPQGGNTPRQKTSILAFQLMYVMSELTAVPKVHVKYVEVPWERYGLPPGTAMQLQLDMLDSQTLFEDEKHSLTEPFSSLKKGCTDHIERMVRFFAEQGTSGLEFAASHWRSLLKEDTWAQTEVLAMKLHHRAIVSGQVCSGYLASGASPGAFILLSVAPSRGDDQLLRYFPYGDYGQFIRREWQRLWAIPNWGQREFVHWMFLWDDHGLDVHLYYLWSAEDMLEMFARQLYTVEHSGKSLAFRPRPMIVPEDLLPPQPGYRMFEALIDEWLKHATETSKR